MTVSIKRRSKEYAKAKSVIDIAAQTSARDL